MVGAIPDISANKNSGLQVKDMIVAVGNDPVEYFDEAKIVLEKYKGRETVLTVDREGRREMIPVVISDSATIGVNLGGLTFDELQKGGYLRLETKKYSLLESIPAGIDKGVTTLTGYVKQLKKIFNPETGAYKGVGGFAAIGSMFPDSWNWPAFWNTTALISIILAFMNILPIPALDGGHVMFLLYEMVSGRKPSDKFMEYAQMTGFFLLIALLLFANGNDIYKAIVK